MKANRQSATFCPRAFHGYNQQTGHVCCMINDQDYYSSRSNLLNSNMVQDIQQTMNRGGRPNACNKCWIAEDQGLQSHRKTVEAAMSEELPDDSLVYLTLFTGNICNFACRTCDSSLSFQLGREERWLNKQYNMNRNGHGRIYANYENILEMDLSQVKTVSVLGGEPFLDPDHFVVLDQIFAQSGTDSCVIHYSTNGSIDVEKYYHKHLKGFKQVKISFSIDAVGDAFEYVRTNGKWNQVEANLMKALGLQQDYKNFSLHFHVTISPLNLFALKDLSDFILKHEIAFKPQVVQQPEYYNFGIFGSDIKEYILDNYDFGVFNNTVHNAFEKFPYGPDNEKMFLKMITRTHQYLNRDLMQAMPLAKPIIDMMKERYA